MAFSVQRTLICGAFIKVAMAVCNDKEYKAAASSIIFDQTDEALGVRTMVIDNDNAQALDNGGFQRSLVLTDASDRSVPCELQWWLDHNPQGMGVCSPAHAGDNNQTISGCQPCHRPMVDDIWNGYIRTMLAIVAFTPPNGQSLIQMR